MNICAGSVDSGWLKRHILCEGNSRDSLLIRCECVAFTQRPEDTNSHTATHTRVGVVARLNGC